MNASITTTHPLRPVTSPDATPQRGADPLGPLLRQALDRSSEAVAIYTADDWVIASMVVYANDAHAELSGFAREHVVGHSALLLAGARPDAPSLASVLPPAGMREHEARVQKYRPDGSSYVVDVRVTPLCDDAGEVTHYLSRERRVAPADASVSSRALERVRDAAFCQLAAGITYELQADLSRCLVSLAAARAAAAGGGGSVAAVGEAEEALASAAATVRGLASFGSESAQERAPVDIHDALELALRLSGYALAERATVERRYARVAPVRASVPRLARAFTHILRNSAEAIPRGLPQANHVTVETRDERDQRDGARSVTVVITDTGVGIERDDLPFVCDPFYSTKPDAATRGLGLTAVRAELSALGGDLRIDSIAGRGTRVRVTLPALEGSIEGWPASPERPSPHPRLLAVADTHAAAREIARPLAERDVQLVLATWDEAFERLALAEPFDLVVCDPRSPSHSGFRARLSDLGVGAAPRVFDVSVRAPADSGVFPCVTTVAHDAAE